jgi:hypothetical protein
LQAYRFAPDPSPAQARLLASHCGAARKAFNEGLAHVKRCLDQREAERSYGVPEEWLTEVPWTLPALRRPNAPGRVPAAAPCTTVTATPRSTSPA